MLGGFGLWHGGVPVEGLNTPRLQSFVGYLLLHRDAAQSRRHLAFLFWPSSTEAQARTNLRKQIYYLHRALPDADRFVDTEGDVVQWRPDAPLQLDVAEFQQGLAEANAAGQRDDDKAERAALERAVAACSGDLLPDCYDDWVLAERERLRQQLAAALERLASLLQDRREYAAALAHARHLLRLDPLYEAACRQVMRLQAARGDRAAAIRTYQATAVVLEKELGVAPSAATTALYQQLLNREAAASRPAASPAFASPLVGRHDEWARLQAAWRAIQDGGRHLVCLSGQAGMGKTRLAEEFLAWARRQGIGTAIARCYASQQDLAYGPVADWLRSEPLQAALGNLERPWLSEIARLLPELLIDRPDVPAPGPLAESWQCQHLFEALARPFGDHDRLVLLADDLHWADGETLEWLTYLLRSATGQRRTAALLVVATVRSEEMPDRQGVQRVLDDLRHYGQLGEIPLGPLSERESLALATNVAGRPLTPDLAAGLYRETEGNPLFIVEMVRAAILEPAGSKGKDAAPGASGTLPPAIQAAIAARLAYLSAAARDLARVAAVIGREFSVEVLARSAAPEGGSGDEEDVVAALDELWQRRIVRRHGGGPSDTAYDFSHEKIRQVIYDEISPARRRYLHSRVASALEAVHGHDLDIMSGEIAAHYERGGRYQEAIAHYRRAADVARRIYANERAIGYYRHLLEGDLAALLSAEETCAVMLDLGRVWQLTGDWPAAEEIYRSALVRAEAAGGGALVARCQHRLGDLVRLRGEYDDALAWLALARDGFEAAGERRGLVGVLWTMGEVYWYQGDPERALATLQRQMEIASEIGNRRAVCDAAGTLGNVYWSLGDLARSRRYCRQSLDLAQEIDHWWAVGRALVTLGQTYAQEGNLEQAFICYDQALEAATQVGDRPCRGRAATAMGDLYGRAGQAGAARACYGYGLMDRLEMGDRRAAAASLAHMAELYARQGDVVRAEALKRRGQTLAQPAEGHGGEGYPPDFAQFDGENGLSSRAATGPAPAIPPVLPDLPAAVRQAAIDIGELLARVDRLLAGPQEE